MIVWSYDALILAGGRGTRMGGADKGLLVWRGARLIDHVLQRLQQQTRTPQQILISANRNLSVYQQYARVLEDAVPGFEGPLRGIQAGLRACQAPWLLVVPCDMPLLPVDLAQALFQRAQGQTAWARCAGQDYPLCTWLPKDCAPALDAFLDQGGRRVRDFLAVMHAQAVDFAVGCEFANFNDPGSLEASS